MVRVISQETFNAVVKENMEEFEMTREEAVKEAIDQFHSQDVDLSNIVTSSTSETLVENIRKLETLISESKSGKIDSSALNNLCDNLGSEVSKGLAEKMLATKEGCYQVLVEVASDLPEAKESAIKALTNLLDGNPDPLDASGFLMIADTLANAETNSESLNKAVLNLILNCCVRHEQNRQNLVRNGLLNKLDTLQAVHPVDVCRVWQSLVQDDDVRVPFGKAHDHAREIVEEHHALEKLTVAIQDGNQSPADLTCLLSCLSNLCVRNEYCQAVVDLGTLPRIFFLLMNPDQKREVVKECLKVIKVLAGNDNVKRDIANIQGIEAIVNALNKHIRNGPICKSGCNAIAAICLRNRESSKQVVDATGAQTLVQILKLHQDNEKILSACALAIRNVISRNDDLIKEFLDLDVEVLLNEVLTKYPNASDEAKAALRDMGLKVHLKEEWKGQPVNMKND